jgi:hypothetical protein
MPNNSASKINNSNNSNKKENQTMKTSKNNTNNNNSTTVVIANVFSKIAGGKQIALPEAIWNVMRAAAQGEKRSDFHTTGLQEWMADAKYLMIGTSKDFVAVEHGDTGAGKADSSKTALGGLSAVLRGNHAERNADGSFVVLNGDNLLFAKLGLNIPTEAKQKVYRAENGEWRRTDLKFGKKVEYTASQAYWDAVEAIANGKTVIIEVSMIRDLASQFLSGYAVSDATWATEEVHQMIETARFNTQSYKATRIAEDMGLVEKAEKAADELTPVYVTVAGGEVIDLNTLPHGTKLQPFWSNGGNSLNPTVWLGQVDKSIRAVVANSRTGAWTIQVVEADSK